jgi:hypothetical protein
LVSFLCGFFWGSHGTPLKEVDTPPSPEEGQFVIEATEAMVKNNL